MTIGDRYADEIRDHDKAKRERDAAIARAEQAEQERDAALAKLARVEALPAKWLVATRGTLMGVDHDATYRRCAADLEAALKGTP